MAPTTGAGVGAPLAGNAARRLPRGLLVGRSLVEFALRYCQVLIELAKPRQIAGGQLHPRRGMTAGPEEEIALLMRRWEQVKAGDGAVVLIGGEPGNREIAPRAAAHRVAEARRTVALTPVTTALLATRDRYPKGTRRMNSGRSLEPGRRSRSAAITYLTDNLG